MVREFLSILLFRENGYFNVLIYFISVIEKKNRDYEKTRNIE